MWRWDSADGLGEHVTCHMLWFGDFFSFFILVIVSRHRQQTNLDESRYLLRKVSFG